MHGVPAGAKPSVGQAGESPGQRSGQSHALAAGRHAVPTENASAVDVGSLVLVPQSVTDYREPAWPGASIVHLDLTAAPEDLDGVVDRAVSLGARLAHPQPDPAWRVLLDPAGHPFCITPFAP